MSIYPGCLLNGVARAISVVISDHVTFTCFFKRFYSQFIVDCAGDVMKVTGLVPGTTYTFSLAAGNTVGFGPFVKFRITLPPEPKPSPAVVREMSGM